MSADQREPARADPAPSCLRIEIAPRTILYLLLAIAGVWIALQLEVVLIIVIVALVLVGTLDPMVTWFERRGIRRGRALVLIFVAISLAFAGALLLTLPPLIEQLLNLIENAPRGRDQLVEWLRQYKIGGSFVQAIEAVPLNDLVVRAGNAMVGYSSDILTMLGYVISTTFLAIYLLADPVHTKGLVFAVVPRHHHIKLARILIELKVIVGGYMRGQLITSVAIAAFTFGVLTVFGVEDALALALFAGMTDIIPFIGGYVASFPVIVAVSGSGAGAVVIVSILMVAYQEFESRFLVPRVYGKVLRLTPTVVLISLLVGGALMGIVGALLALPIAAGLQMLVHELRVELPGETPHDASTLARDLRAEHIYEQLTEGATAAHAGVIASELAQKLKQNEQNGGPVSAEFPAIMAELADVAVDPDGAIPATVTDAFNARTAPTEATASATSSTRTARPASDLPSAPTDGTAATGPTLRTAARIPTEDDSG